MSDGQKGSGKISNMFDHQTANVKISEISDDPTYSIKFDGQTHSVKMNNISEYQTGSVKIGNKLDGEKDKHLCN